MRVLLASVTTSVVVTPARCSCVISLTVSTFSIAVLRPDISASLTSPISMPTIVPVVWSSPTLVAYRAEKPKQN